MTGEFFALLSAACYGTASVTIGKAKETAVGDNGVFLSIIVTCGLTLILWLMWGSVSFSQVWTYDSLPGLGAFALAGFFSTVLGRTAMYRATERIGAVKASLFRRAIPVFALPSALVLLGEWPNLNELIGGAFIVLGALSYQMLPRRDPVFPDRIGDLIGIGSAVLYALAYVLRRIGLEHIADPLFGTLAGALLGLVWVVASTYFSKNTKAGLGSYLSDRGPWHWVTALALGTGQTFQFFALSAAPVSTVAILGALDVFFAAALISLIARKQSYDGRSLILSAGIALVGSVIFFA